MSDSKKKSGESLYNAARAKGLESPKSFICTDQL